MLRQPTTFFLFSISCLHRRTHHLDTELKNIYVLNITSTNKTYLKNPITHILLASHYLHQRKGAHLLLTTN